jgi:hypothetical protein
LSVTHNPKMTNDEHIHAVWIIDHLLHLGDARLRADTGYAPPENINAMREHHKDQSVR